MCGEVEVEANNRFEAAIMAQEAPLPPADEQSYVFDSANCDVTTDVVEIK